jgi:hypothetical protein
MSLYLDQNDRELMLSQVEAKLGTPAAPGGAFPKRPGLYAALSTICLGRVTAVGNYVLTNFKLNYDLLKYVFDDVQYNTVGILETNSQLYQFNKVPLPTPRQSRSTTSTVSQIKRKTGSRAFQGKRVKFVIPSTKAAQLDKSGFKKASNRLSASMLFPYAATNPQIAAWFSTHQTPGGTNVGAIITEKGTAINYKNIPTQVAHDAEVGVFNSVTRLRLKTVTSTEVDPA